jgi:coiled-coil-helix-coiled-coil-helix domain-containing protein 2
MLSNIASTAAGVAIGNVVGHGVMGLFGGGSTTAPAEAAAAAPATNTDTKLGICDADARAFTKCMDDYKGDMTVCSWYLEQLKVISRYDAALIPSLVSKWRVNTSY